MVAPLVRYQKLGRNLPRGAADPGNEKQVDCKESLVQWSPGVVEQRPRLDIEPSFAAVAVILLVHLPVEAVFVLFVLHLGQVAFAPLHHLAFFRTSAQYFSLAVNLPSVNMSQRQ